MLLWCFAPEMGLRIAAVLRADPSVRTSAAQAAVLGFKLSDLRHALIAEWHLAALLQSLMGDAQATHPRAMNVALAVNLARHSAAGWDNPALPGDYAAIQQFLKLPQPEVLARIGRSAQQAQVALDWYHLQAVPVPAELVRGLSGIQESPKTDDR